MTFMSFDSMDEMRDYMRRSEERAIASMTEEQKAIKPGDAWASPRPEYQCVIFGKSKSLDEIEASEKSYWSDSDDAEQRAERKAELEYTMESSVDSISRGYLFGEAWSILEPRGELGSTHVSQMVKITDEALEDARERDWDFGRCIADGLPWALNLLEGRPASATEEDR
jgi:hypothetical protein